MGPSPIFRRAPKATSSGGCQCGIHSPVRIAVTVSGNSLCAMLLAIVADSDGGTMQPAFFGPPAILQTRGAVATLLVPFSYGGLAARCGIAGPCHYFRLRRASANGRSRSPAGLKRSGSADGCLSGHLGYRSEKRPAERRFSFRVSRGFRIIVAARRAGIPVSPSRSPPNSRRHASVGRTALSSHAILGDSMQGRPSV